MTTTFDFNTLDELNPDFIERLKRLYEGKTVQFKLAVEEETYPMSELLRRIEDVEAGRNLVSFSEEEFSNVVRELTEAKP
jgi:hypothetical protein